MSNKKIEQILKNSKFTMEMEGFTIDNEQEEIGRKILIGELKLSDYIESVKKEASRYAYEV